MSCEIISDDLLIAIVLKRLMREFKPFAIAMKQKDKVRTFRKFKVLRIVEETEKKKKKKKLMM